MTHLKLPRFQYTAHEPVSGACFTGHADELSKSYATFRAEQLSVHLTGHGVDLSRLTWQTDNGSEFLENQDAQGLHAAVPALGSIHRYIPPKRYTWQSDVETVHRLVEDEFFDRESFTGPADFWRKATTYWHYFNLVRPNRGKEWQSPLQIKPRLSPGKFSTGNLSTSHNVIISTCFPPTTGVTIYPAFHQKRAVNLVSFAVFGKLGGKSQADSILTDVLSRAFGRESR